MTEENFFAERMTALRLRRGISEYKMSLDMGHSGSYINSIASGKALPSMGEFLYMCEYLGVTPAEFFDEKIPAPISLKELNEAASGLSEKDIDLLVAMAKRLAEKNGK